MADVPDRCRLHSPPDDPCLLPRRRASRPTAPEREGGGEHMSNMSKRRRLTLGFLVIGILGYATATAYLREEDIRTNNSIPGATFHSSIHTISPFWAAVVLTTLSVLLIGFGAWFVAHGHPKLAETRKKLRATQDRLTHLETIKRDAVETRRGTEALLKSEV